MKKRKKLHLIIDASCLFNSHYSGVENFTLFFLRELDAQARQGDFSYDLLIKRSGERTIANLGLKNYRALKTNYLPLGVIKALSMLCLPLPFDCFFGRGYYYFPSYTFFPVMFNPYALVIHDHTYLQYPQAVSFKLRTRLRWSLGYYLRHSRQIFAVAAYTRLGFPQFYGIGKSRVVVTSPAVDSTHFYPRSQKQVSQLRRKYHLGSQPYLLVLGNIEPKKNLRRVIAAYRQLSKRLIKQYNLLLVGDNAWHHQEILQDIAKAQKDGLPVKLLLGKIAHQDIPTLLTGAKALVFASLYEGFCMPPMEAYACGTPVIASNFGSSDEAIGKAAVARFNPYQVGAITTAMAKVIALKKEQLAVYQRLMKAHIAQHTWQHTVATTLASCRASLRKT